MTDQEQPRGKSDISQPSNVVDMTKWTGVEKPVEQPEAEDTTFGQDLDRMVQVVGRRFGGNTLASARRRGVAIFTAGTIAVIGAATVIGINNYRGSQQSDIPTSTANFNPSEDHFTTVPVTGAASLAEQADPSHNKEIGVQHMQDQLGHYPEPGDRVELPGAQRP